MTQEEDDPVPAWLKPMLRPELTIKKNTTSDDLNGEMEERLAAVLRAYGFNNGGWREVALQLILEHEPAFQIRTPLDRPLGADGKKLSGANQSIDRWAAYLQMKKFIRKGKTNAGAAREVKKLFPDFELSYLKNLPSAGVRGEVESPRFFRRHEYEQITREALNTAADKLGS